MDLKDWLPTAIATGALGFIWLLIRASLNSMKDTLKEDLKKVWQEISKIKDTYMEEDKHRLICGKSALEIEKLFKQCLNDHKDAVFGKLRELERQLKDDRE